MTAQVFALVFLSILHLAMGARIARAINTDSETGTVTAWRTISMLVAWPLLMLVFILIVTWNWICGKV